MSADSQTLLEQVRVERAAAIAREGELRRPHHQLLEARDENNALVGYGCSCKLWGLNMPLGDETAQAAATADILERHREHVEREVNTKVEWGYGVKCVPMRITSAEGRVSTGMLCGVSRGRKRCQFCKKEWSIAQCDFPLPNPCKKCKGTGLHDGYNCETCAGTGRRMCNKHLCGDCRAHKAPDEDYCPEHRAEAGLIKRERCGWAINPAITRKDCLHKGCEQILPAGKRVLFFPERSRAMCGTCGSMYLEVAK